MRGVMGRGLLVAAVVAGGIAVASRSEAVPIYAGYPAPGGTTFSSTGSSLIDNTGVTRNYSGFDSNAWDALYWNITSAGVNLFNSCCTANIGVDTSTASGSVAGNTVTWNLGTLVVGTGFGTYSTPVSLVTMFFDWTSTPITSFVAGSPGMPTTVLKITPADLSTWAGGFRVNQRVLAGAGSLQSWFDSIPGKSPSASLGTSTGAAFWYDPPTEPVPEPGTVLLVGSGLSALLLRRRRSA